MEVAAQRGGLDAPFAVLSRQPNFRALSLAVPESPTYSTATGATRIASHWRLADLNPPP